MKTIMLIEDEEQKIFILSTSIVKRLMMNGKVIGGWLTAMLQSRNRKVADRAVEYLKAVSDMSFLGEKQRLSSGKCNHNGQGNGFDALVNEVSRLEDFVPALLALGDRGVEEASTTLIVQRVLDIIISRPFAVTVILCDGIFLALLMFGFRSAIDRLISGGSLDRVLEYIYVANTGIFYFIIREIGKTVSLFLISKRSRIFFLSFWNLIDVLTTVLALVSTITMRYHFTFHEDELRSTRTLRGLLAVTTGFLWLRVLSLLKGINKQLATFVLAILQITKDILWFCVILLTLVVSFAQMFYTLLAPATCASGNDSKMVCDQNEYLLRTYRVLLGDFGAYDRATLTSKFSVFLIVFYSFMVTVILLNVLIAIASDSYEKCLLRSQNLFGRARVMLIAQLVCLQSLLRKKDNSQDDFDTSTKTFILRPIMDWRKKRWNRGSGLFFSLSLGVVVIWAIGETVGYTRGKSNSSIFFSLLSVIVNCVLFSAMIAFLSSGAASISPKKEDRREAGARKNGRLRRWTSGWNDGFIQNAMLRLLGTSHKIPDGGLQKKRDIEEWTGRVNYLQREMTRIADEAERRANDQTKVMENLVSLSETRLRGEMVKLEESFLDLKQSLLEEVKGTKETNANVTIVVEELKTLISMAASTSAYRSPVPSEVDVTNVRFARFNGDSNVQL